MISAPSTPTPMKATTRPMPQVTVTASCRRHGRMNPSSVRMVSGQPTSAASCARSRTTTPVSSAGAQRWRADRAAPAATLHRSVRQAADPSAGDTVRPARSASAWLPLCATAPSSSTRMRSALITLDRRCARISVVRPAISRSSACWMTASFSASTEDSASSSTRIGASRSSARAMAMRWRWPPDRRAPRSPITVW